MIQEICDGKSGTIFKALHDARYRLIEPCIWLDEVLRDAEALPV